MPPFELLEQFRGHLQSEARLAGSGWAGQGEEPHPGGTYEVLDTRQLNIAPNKGGKLHLQVVGWCFGLRSESSRRVFGDCVLGLRFVLNGGLLPLIREPPRELHEGRLLGSRDVEVVGK